MLKFITKSKLRFPNLKKLSLFNFSSSEFNKKTKQESKVSGSRNTQKIKNPFKPPKIKKKQPEENEETQEPKDDESDKQGFQKLTEFLIAREKYSWDDFLQQVIEVH